MAYMNAILLSEKAQKFFEISNRIGKEQTTAVQDQCCTIRLTGSRVQATTIPPCFLEKMSAT